MNDIYKIRKRIEIYNKKGREDIGMRSSEKSGGRIRNSGKVQIRKRDKG